MGRVTDNRRLRHQGFIIGDKSFVPKSGIADYIPYVVDENKYPLTEYDRLRLAIYDTEMDAQEAVKKLQAVKKQKYTVVPYEPKLYGEWRNLARIESESDELAIVDILFLLVSRGDSLDYNDRTDIMRRLGEIRQNILKALENK